MRLLLSCLLAGVVLGACTDICEDRPRGTIDIPVVDGSYRIEAIGSLEGGTAEVAADSLTLEVTNPDGATVRIRYDVSEPTWSEAFAR